MFNKYMKHFFGELFDTIKNGKNNILQNSKFFCDFKK